MPSPQTQDPGALVVSRNDLREDLGQTTLWRTGIDRRQVGDPKAAFEEAKQFNPNLVIIDLNDEKDVRSLIVSLRDNETTKTTAIVVLSRDLTTDFERAIITAGANLVIPLPFNADLWSHRLEQFLLVPPRCETRTPVRAALWTYEITEDASEFQGTALNISSGGMLVETDRMIQVGSKLDIKFRLPGQTEELVVLAQVVWTAQIPDDLFHSGIQFLVMRDNARVRISEYLSGAMSKGEGTEPLLSQAVDDRDEKSSWERELRISESRKMSIIDASISPIVTTDAQGFILEFNTTAELLFGYKRSQLIGKNVMDTIVPPSKRNRLHEEYRRLITESDKLFERIQFETTALHRGGDEFPVEVVLIPMMVNGRLLLTAFLRDLSELKSAAADRDRLEARLRQSQKLEAIGTLASGIAHEFNNILSAIVGFSELTLTELDEDSLSRSNITEILSATDRARDVVRQILTFAHQEETEKRLVKIDEVVREVLGLIRKTFPSTIKIAHEIDENTGTVFADPTQIHQVVLNLCTNALQSIQDEGGTISLYLDPVAIDSKLSTLHSGLPTGRYALLVVKDSGAGMDSAIVPRIFEPFFTTKEVGEGTGLGLSVVYGIVQSLGGAVFVESKESKGSTFRVYLPLRFGLEEEREEQPSRPKSSRQRILFVDDDPALVRLAEKSLAALGHTVTALTSSEEALAVFLNDPDSFDVLITDQVMPGLTGLELLLKARTVAPELPVIVCTGFHEFSDKLKASELNVNAIILKPLKQADLADAIDTVLSTRP